MHLRKFFAPRRWTILTWAVTSLWFLGALLGNIPTSPSTDFLDVVADTPLYRDTGATRVMLSTGWPLDWHDQNWTLQGQLVATRWRLQQLLLNVLAVCITLVTLIYLLQTYVNRISIKGILGGTAVVAIILVLGQYMAVKGHGLAWNYLINCIYFCPPILAIMLGSRGWLRRKLAATEQRVAAEP